MISPKEVLVVTTSNLQNINIQKYVKPVSAHVVAGTNAISDIAASFSDFFGGRSESYQKQLTSLYNEAIERIKVSAFELGANCVLGLSVDMDEISGKNKSMFMITAVGTAVIIDEQPKKSTQVEDKYEHVSFEKLLNFQKKSKILKDSETPYWSPTEDTWNFIAENQVEDVLPALLRRYLALYSQMQGDDVKMFYKQLKSYINNFDDDQKRRILYTAILTENDNRIATDLAKIVRDLQLLDYGYVYKLLDHPDFQVQKRALPILGYDKPFYNKSDIAELSALKEIVEQKFKERGSRTTKKGLLSSKEKEVWECECGKINDIGYSGVTYCSSCNKDLFGFTTAEINQNQAIQYLDKRIELISHFVK